MCVQFELGRTKDREKSCHSGVQVSQRETRAKGKGKKEKGKKRSLLFLPVGVRQGGWVACHCLGEVEICQLSQGDGRSKYLGTNLLLGYKCYELLFPPSPPPSELAQEF